MCIQKHESYTKKLAGGHDRAVSIMEACTTTSAQDEHVLRSHCTSFVHRNRWKQKQASVTLPPECQ